MQPLCQKYQAEGVGWMIQGRELREQFARVFEVQVGGRLLHFSQRAERKLYFASIPSVCGLAFFKASPVVWSWPSPLQLPASGFLAPSCLETSTAASRGFFDRCGGILADDMGLGHRAQRHRFRLEHTPRFPRALLASRACQEDADDFDLPELSQGGHSSSDPQHSQYTAQRCSLSDPCCR